MLDQVLNFFNINPDYDLDLMKPNQSLFNITVACIKGLEKIFIEYSPDLVFIQGDTTSAFLGALAGYYRKCKVVHIEAGLRSDNKYSPFPEEMNRILADHLSDYYFAPTERARKNLYIENIKKNIWVVGNTVIDALLLGVNYIKEDDEKLNKKFNYLDLSKKLILVTGHRRESFGEPFKSICYALKEISECHEDVQIIYPVHLNPNVKDPVYKILENCRNIFLIKPLSYPYLIWIMKNCYLVLTDSGGIQEEAPSLGKPVLVMREVTERVEGIECGTAKLVGTDKDSIVYEVSLLLDNPQEYERMSKAINPYGDGTTSKQIVNILTEEIRKGVMKK